MGSGGLAVGFCNFDVIFLQPHPLDPGKVPFLRPKIHLF